jgi:hypothetical protein
MELCILKFDGNYAADDALSAQLNALGDNNPWLYDVGVISRPLIGRVRIGASFPDGNSTTFREGDLAKAGADVGGHTGYYLAQLMSESKIKGRVKGRSAGKAAGSELENQLFHIDAIKQALPRDSSALVLIADSKLCDTMVDTFKDYEPAVVRRNVGDELRARLQSVADEVVQAFAEAEGPEAPL